jgi:hypothetical protein
MKKRTYQQVTQQIIRKVFKSYGFNAWFGQKKQTQKNAMIILWRKK